MGTESEKYSSLQRDAKVHEHSADRIVLPEAPSNLFEYEDDEDVSDADTDIGDRGGEDTDDEITASDFSKEYFLLPQQEDNNIDTHGLEVIKPPAESKNQISVEKSKAVLTEIFSNARGAADAYYSSLSEYNIDADQINALIEETTYALIAADELISDLFRFSTECIQSNPTEEFFREYFAAVERAGENSVKLNEHLKDYIGIRARLGALIRLKVPTEATSKKVQTSKQQITRTEDGAALAAYGDSSHTVRMDSDSVLTRILRAPARSLRRLLGAAIFGLGTTVPAYEHSQHTPDASPAPETTQTVLSDTADSTLPNNSVNVEAEGVGNGAEKADSDSPVLPLEAPVYSIPTSLRWDGDTVSHVVYDMLRERGLSTSRTNVQYFTHKVLTDNKLSYDDAAKLGVNAELDFTNAANEMVPAPSGDSSVKGVDASESPVDASSTLENDEDASVIGTDNDAILDAANTKASKENAEVVYKKYEHLPTTSDEKHRMVKGESIYKIVHNMLRASDLNWTSERINFLTQLVVNKNADQFREMVKSGKMRKMDEAWIPEGAVLDFSDAVGVVNEMAEAKKAGKKAKTVRELAKTLNYEYPITMKFPKT